MDDDQIKAIFEAKMVLSNFLKEHPHMREYQEKIDKVLEKAGSNPHNRLVMLQSMMLEKDAERAAAMRELREEAIKTLKKMEEVSNLIKEEQRLQELEFQKILDANKKKELEPPKE
jgi:hypothetical protein